MKNLLTLNYWFSLRPEALQPLAQKLFLALLVLILLAGVAFFFLKRRSSLYRGLFRRLYNFGLTNFLIGLFLLFFNYEAVPFFSARFWLGLWLIGMLVWLIFIFRQLRAIPEKKKQIAKEKEIKKYLP